jgi:hypothetical protein
MTLYEGVNLESIILQDTSKVIHKSLKNFAINPQGV